MNTELIKETYRAASSGEGQIYSRIWLPQKEPVALIEIVHGMAEHIGRYDAFAAYLAERGFVVFGNDHAGHGKSVTDGRYGYFAKKDGWENTIRDIDALLEDMRAQYPGLPAFMLGHSMGSILACGYLASYGAKLAGAILSGAVWMSPAAKIGRLLTSVVSFFQGGRAVSNFLIKLSQKGFLDRIPDARSKNAWLSRDEKVEDEFNASEMCGFPFTNRALYDFAGGMIEVYSPGWAHRVPQLLPVYLFSGDQDAVSNYGQAARQLYSALKDTGHRDLELKLYEGGRHEMLNELNKQEVYEDVFDWLKRHMP